MRKILNNQGLKCIALISMTADHVGYALFPGQLWLRCVGRLAFVIYAFLISEGYVHTKNLKRYAGRLAMLAVISEVPFDLMINGRFFYRDSQNVFFTLLLGLLTIAVFKELQKQLLKSGLTLSPLGSLLETLALMLCVVCGCGAALFIRSDYTLYGVLMVVIFYIARDNMLFLFISQGIMMSLMGYVQLFGLLAFVPLALYNGQRGSKSSALMWLFYFYYPVHMLAIYGLAQLVG